jgi:hypothetical protein
MSEKILHLQSNFVEEGSLWMVRYQSRAMWQAPELIFFMDAVLIITEPSVNRWYNTWRDNSPQDIRCFIDVKHVSMIQACLDRFTYCQLPLPLLKNSESEMVKNALEYFESCWSKEWMRIA